ncbi:MAG: hypothetical protein IJS53_00935, partial [Clostridia bacterium]|nr:hypothetical protein [Clostridia bacterium]
PATALAARLGYAMRLQTLMEISPNTLSWSLMLLAEMLLFLTAFAGSGVFLTRCLEGATPLRRAPLLPFSLACVPLAALGAEEGSSLLLALAPWRAPLLAAGLLLSLCANLLRKRKTA